MIHCRVCVPPPARREGDALLAIDCFSDIDMLLDEAGSATLRGGCVAEPRAKLDCIIAGSSGFQGGLRSPLVIHPRSPARCLVLRSFQAFRGGFRAGWTPKKIALTLAKLRTAPPQHTKCPGRNRKNNDLAAEGESFSSQPHTICTEKTVSKRFSEKVFSGASGGQMPLPQTRFRHCPTATGLQLDS
jgi:hypothetical protein